MASVQPQQRNRHADRIKRISQSKHETHDRYENIYRIDSIQMHSAQNKVVISCDTSTGIQLLEMKINFWTWTFAGT